MKRRIFAMLLALVMVFSMAVTAFADEAETNAGSSVVLEIEQMKGNIKVGVYLQGCEGVTNGRFSVDYDASAQTLIDVQTTDAYSMNSVNSEVDGTVSFAWIDSNLGSEKTLMLTLTFEVKELKPQSIAYSASCGELYADGSRAEASADEESVVMEMDYSRLEAAIAEAEGKEKDDYVNLTFVALNNALSQAKKVLADAAATQAEIDEAEKNLREAISNLIPVSGSNAGKEDSGVKEENRDEDVNPETGNDANIPAWIAVMLASGLGALIVWSSRSKKAKRLFCMLLAVLMVVSVAPINVLAVVNGEETENSRVTISEDLQKIVDQNKNSIVDAGTVELGYSVSEIENPGFDLKVEQDIAETEVKLFEDDQMVRIIVELKGASLLEQGYTVGQISANGVRVSAETEVLMSEQAVIEEKIIEVVNASGLLAEEEKVAAKYNYTAALNGMAMSVPYGTISEIRKIEGVKEVYLTAEYLAPETTGTAASPNMFATAETFGSAQTWTELGYTGTGMVIAIIDSGIDVDHPSFVDAPELNEDSLYYGDIESILPSLKAYSLYAEWSPVELTADDVYYSEKIPYGFNYVDVSTDVTHDYDGQGDHGTHVAGIAAANKIATTPVVGVAPDAQLIGMKVFGANGGAYSDDIIAAIEDCILIGVDAINMSLGAPAGFYSDDYLIDEVFGKILDTDILLVVSAGNSGSAASNNSLGTNLNFTKDPDNGIIGSPASYVATTVVASLENTQLMMPYFSVGENKIIYIDVTYYEANKFPSLNGTYEYVVVPGVGDEADYEGLDVEGKIALVMRGTIDFTEKQFNAYANGAVALIVYNNVVGEYIYMYDGGYLPNVFISKADGEKMLAAAVDGVGTIEIHPYGTETAMPSASAGYASDFSSWGVTPDLQLVPDVTAPGGNIYSCFMDGNYGTMSGTSMSAPHISGMSALVLQYLKEEHPELEGRDRRTVAEALVMSTAEPILDEYEVLYSPRKQGAGSANVYAAVTSPVYLTGYQELTGELTPKASIGDDDERKGVYEFEFDMNNFSDTEQVFALDGVTLTDDYIDYYGIYKFMSETGRYLTSDIAFYSSDLEYVQEYDLNNDGVTNEKDVQLLLDYVNGVSAVTEAWDHSADAALDFNNDGVLDTADAYSFLGRLGEKNYKTLVTVPANASITVKVVVTLSDEDKAYMDANYPNGIYVDGFVRAYAQSEGGVDLSFPFMAFYGDWSDADVFDSGWYYEDEETLLYNRYLNVIFSELGSGATGLGLNPYLANDPYTPEHNVLSPNGDGYFDTVNEIYISLLRAAELLDFTWTNEEGEEIFYEWYAYARKSYFWPAYGLCLPAMYTDVCAPFTMYDDEGNLMVEDLERLTLTIRGYLDDGDLDDTLEIDEDGNPIPDTQYADDEIVVPVVIDLTAPKADINSIEYFEEDGRSYIAVPVEDNYDIAAVVTTTAGGGAYDYFAVNEKVEGVEGEKDIIVIDVTDYDATFYLVVCDYGCNETYYEIKNVNSVGLSSDRFYAYRRYAAFEQDGNYYVTDQLNGWNSFTDPGASLAHTSQPQSGEATVYAAEYVDGYIFGAQAGENGYNTLFVSKAGSWDRIPLGGSYAMRKTVYEWPGRDGTYFPLQMIALDMTFDYSSNTMYILANALENEYYFPEGVANILLELDILTGDVTVLGIIEEENGNEFLALTLACDLDGNLYAINYEDGLLYAINKEPVSVTPKYGYGTYIATCVDADGKTAYYPAAYSQSMTFDHETGVLYWAGYQGKVGNSYFFALDTQGNVLSYTPTDYNAELVGLIKPYNSGADIIPAAEAEYIDFSTTNLYLNVGGSALLNVISEPYNAELGEITFYSEDESVAVVNEYGFVEAVGIGSTYVVAVMDDGEYGLEAYCAINVSEVSGMLFAYDNGWYIMDAGRPFEASQIMDVMEFKEDETFAAAAYRDGYIYVATVVEDYDEDWNAIYSTNLYKLDVNTLYGDKIGTYDGKTTALAFNYADGFMYGLTYNEVWGEFEDWWGDISYDIVGVSYDLIRVNLKTAETAVVSNLDEIFTYDLTKELYSTCSGALAIDYEGNFYVNGDYNAEEFILARFNLDENDEIANVVSYPYYSAYGYSGDALLWSESNNGLLHVFGTELEWSDVSDMENVLTVSLGYVRSNGWNVLGLVAPIDYEPELPVVAPTAISLEEVYSVAAGGYVEIIPSVDPWNATGEFVYEIEDEEVAQVINFMGYTFLVGMEGAEEKSTILTATEVNTGLTATAVVEIKENPGNLVAYFQGSLESGVPLESWGEIPITDPENYSFADAESEFTIYGGTYYNGYIYVCGQHNVDGCYYLIKMNPYNYGYTVISMPDIQIRGMAFDYTTGSMYAVGNDEVVMGGIYAVDLETGKLTFLADAYETLAAIAIDDEGNIYAASTEGTIFVYDAEGMYFDYTGLFGNQDHYLQSMTYDYNTDAIYWANSGELLELDFEEEGFIWHGNTGCTISVLYTVPKMEIEIPEEVAVSGVVLDEKDTVAVGESIAIEAVVLPVSVATVDQTLIWMSDDESIATVDENGVVTGVSEGETYIYAMDPSGWYMDTIMITVTEEPAAFYGYDELSRAWVKFGENGKIVETWADAEGLSPIVAAQYIKGVLCAYDEEGFYYEINTETFERTLIGNGINGITTTLEAYDRANGAYYVEDVPYKVIDMTYEVTRRGINLYVVMMAHNVSEWQDDFSYIVARVDFATGEVVDVIVEDKLVDNSMSLRPSNLLYRQGYLYTINGYISGHVTRIGFDGEVTGLAICPSYWGDFNGGRSMIEDPYTGKIYAIRDMRTEYIGSADYDDSKATSVLCEMHLGIAKCEEIATIGNNMRITGLFIK